jgi:hypothetical protein
VQTQDVLLQPTHCTRHRDQAAEDTVAAVGDTVVVAVAAVGDTVVVAVVAVVAVVVMRAVVAVV